MKSCFSASLMLLATLFSSHAFAQSAFLLPPDTVVDGKSQAQWSVEWWQWAASFDQERSPIADKSGALCAGKQAGKVWFLAGTYGTARTIRSCTVPAGKYLFFPLINYVAAPSLQGSTCERVTATAERLTNHASMLVLEVDGHRYQNLDAHRFASPECFNIADRAQPPVEVFPSASNGYYVMLKPLPRGKHVLNFGGALPTMQQAVTYTLTVK